PARGRGRRTRALETLHPDPPPLARGREPLGHEGFVAAPRSDSLRAGEGAPRGAALLGATCSASSQTGRRKVTSRPPSGAFSARMVPPCSFTARSAIARPRPVP